MSIFIFRKSGILCFHIDSNVQSWSPVTNRFSFMLFVKKKKKRANYNIFLVKLILRSTGFKILVIIVSSIFSIT